MKKTVYVQWMDCVSCETVLRDSLDAVPNIKVLSLTHKTWKMTIEYKNIKLLLHKVEIQNELNNLLFDDEY